MVKSKVSINDEALNLMEFGQMSPVESFVSEHSIDGEEFSRPEWHLFGYLL